MTHGIVLFSTLFNNLAIFIALVTSYKFLIRKFSGFFRIKRQALTGFSFGVFAIGCVYAKIPVFEGVAVDQRHAIIVLSGAFGGPVSAIISAVMTGMFSPYLGGSDAFAGVFGVTLSAIAGIVLYGYKKNFESAKKAALSAFFATLAILPAFLFVNDLQTGWALLKTMALPYGTALFCVIFLIGFTLKKQEENFAIEQSFRKNQERLDLAVTGAEDGFWDWDLKSDSIYFSPKYKEILGFTDQEFSNDMESWRSSVYPDDLASAREAFRKVIAGEADHIDHEFRMRHKDGSLRWTHTRGTSVRNDKGVVCRLAGTHTDITKRKQAEIQLAESEEKYRLLTEHSVSIINVYEVILDAHGRPVDFVFLSVNPAFDLQTDMKASDVLGRRVTEVIPGIEKTPLIQVFGRVALTGESTSFYHYFEPFKRHYLVNAYKIGEKRFAAVSTNITEQKQAEEELRRLRNYLANIIDSMPSVLVGVDAQGMVTQWNRRAEQVTGILSDKAFSQPLTRVFPDLTNAMDRIRTSIRDGRVHRDLKVVRQNREETRYEDVIIFPLTANGVEGAIIRVDDVTEQVRMEEMMIQSEKMLSVGGLAAGMAHEINNPLAGMIQTAGTMKSRLGDLTMRANIKAADEIGVSIDHIKAFMEKRGILRMVDAIVESGQRVAEIVDNMLSFARKPDTVVSIHHPAQLMDRILELAAADYDQKKYDFKRIKIVREYEEDLPMIPCEGGKIQQVLLNILRNGAQAMQDQDADDGYTPCFILRLAKEKNMLRIEIEDNGAGMDDAIQSRIFEPFFTTKPVGVGTGLGLSVSYFIITQNHGGTLDVVSSPGKGSTFIIRLPLERNG